MLETSSLKFCRQGSYSGTYYYEAIHVTASTTGTYIIQSYSSMDTYGFIYTGTFDPSNTPSNLFMYNDDGAGNNQFQFTVILEAGMTYILVVSTFGQYATGAFSITAKGPGTFTYNNIAAQKLVTISQSKNLFDSLNHAKPIAEVVLSKTIRLCSSECYAFEVSSIQKNYVHKNRAILQSYYVKSFISFNNRLRALSE